MVSKTAFQTFQADWQKTAAWAQSQGITEKQFMPIYNMDAQKLLQNGSGMSQSERTRAVLAGAGKGLTQLPQDNPSPTDVFGNTLKNAEQIFTGLFNVPSLVKNIFDTVTNTVEHPLSQVANPIYDMARLNSVDLFNKQSRNKDLTAWSSAVLGNHSILAFVPGAVDLAHLEQGKAGEKYLATNPLTSILDVLPIGKLTGGAISRIGGDVAAETATRAGVSLSELKDMSAGQLAWRITKNSKSPFGKVAVEGEKKATKQVLGKLPSVQSKELVTVYKDQTVGEFVSSLRNHFGAGAEQAGLLKAIRVHENVGQREMMKILKPFNQAWSKLSKDETLQVNSYLANEFRVTDTRPLSQIIDDPRFTIEQREVIHATVKLDRWFTKQKINAGELKWVNTAHGRELYLAGGERAKAVEAASARMVAAKDKLDAAKLKINILLTKTQEADGIMMDAFDQIDRYQQTLYSALESSLPDLTAGTKTYDELTKALPKDRRPGLFSHRRTNIGPEGKKNLERFFGLDEKVEKRVYRGGGKDAVPFSGSPKDWSPAERAAWDEAKKSSERLPPDAPVPTRTSIQKLAEKRLQITTMIHDVRVHAPVPWQTAQILAELISPGGLIEQAVRAFENQEFTQLHALSKVIFDKLGNKSFQSATRSEELKRLDDLSDVLYQYSKERDKATKQIEHLWSGKVRGRPAKDTVAALVADVEEANKNFLDESNKYPPAVWDTYMRMEFNRQLAKREEGQAVAKHAIKQLRREGLDKTTLTALKENPEIINEMSGLSAIVSEENDMLPNVETGVAAEINNDVRKMTGDLRAKGLKPLYLPTLHPFDRYGGASDLYNIGLGRTSIKREQASFEKAIDGAQGTIYNYEAGMNKAVREYVTHSHEVDFQAHEMQQFLYDRTDLEKIIRAHFGAEMRANKIIPDVPGGPRAATYDKFVEDKLQEWGLRSYDPTSIFSTGNPKILANKEQFIHKDILSGLEKSFARTHSDAFLMKGYDTATGLFRTSILGYSFRFTAHIIIGGTMMLAAKSSPQALRGVHDAWHMTRAMSAGKDIPQYILDRYNLKPEDITLDKIYTHNSTQEGMADLMVQNVMGYSASQYAIQEAIARAFGKDAADFKHPDFITHWLKFLPEKNYKLTRFSTSMQRSVAFLDGLRQASRKESFFINEWDEAAKEVTRTEYRMTPEQAVEEAMNHVNEVMGDVRNMTPIEYNVLTRVFPFWAWTRHVLDYVTSYPGDHPYRAMFLSQMSRISEQEQPPGLPLRSQLLFFLGNPDQSGNVSAIDIRAANPLRDTAQYATLSGWLSALNPVLTAPFSKIDPSITFGTNVLYPNLSYSQLYGNTEAQPSGTWLGSAEGIVPELSSLDAALNLSGQFAYLQKGNRNAYIKKVMEGLNFPWLPQSLNLRQIAAKNEIDRYQQAKAAADSAWKSGDFSQLKGYGKVPDPRNTQWDVSPDALQSVYNETAALIGPSVQPGEVAATTPHLPNPQY